MKTPLPLNLTATAVPEEVGLIVKLLIEGNLSDLVIVARQADGSFIDGVFSGIDGNPSDTFGMLGAMQVTQRDWMRMHVDGRVEYVETESGDDDEEL
jgi:uncharacterized protein YabN with tetrapyrrole methylase and pyrophosphatase domain